MGLLDLRYWTIIGVDEAGTEEGSDGAELASVVSGTATGSLSETVMAAPP